MVTTGMTGALRSAFASPAPVAARWRAVHTLAYPAWCSALVHGLFAGRPAKTWVVVMYSLCLLAVLGAIALRAAPQPFKRRVAAQVLALLSPGARGAAGRERPSRRDAAAAPLPGANASLLGEVAGVPAQRSRPPQEPRMPAPSPPLYEAPAPPSSVPSANASASAATGSSASSARPTGAGLGMAAAYRAVSMPPPPFPEELPGTFPDDFRAAESTYAESQLPLDLQPTETLPRMDDGSGTGRWPTPSPPPPAEAPPSAYDPLTDTLYGGTATYPAYDDSYDPYANYGDNPAADPLTDPLTGPFQAPSSGEPWNAPTGGRK
jgi:hypothetical protein